MRLHLPLALRRALYLAVSSVAATVATQTAEAAVLFDGVGLNTYADFGQNCGRYVAGEVNAMLQAIRERDNGIVITYQSDSYKPYTIPLEQGMIDFSSASSTPVDAAVGYGFLATVAHNGALNPTYSANDVGGQNAIHYITVDFKRGTEFHMEAATDYKVSRLNKLVTDAQPSELYSGAHPREELNGQYLYRTGSGAMELALIDPDGVWRRTQELEVPYTFATGGIVVVEWADPPSHLPDHDANFGIFHHVNPNVSEEIAAQPLPYRVRSGDSGSPTWVWNPDTKTYQYISAAQSGGQYFNQDRGDLEWSKYSMERFNVTPDLGTSDDAHTITLSAVDRPGQEIIGEGDTVPVSTIPYSGSMSYVNAAGEKVSKDFVGVQSGKHTWKALNPIKDEDNWFNYGNEYFNATKYGAEKTDEEPAKFSYADLFVTNSLVFEAGDEQTYNVQLEADVELGIGFVQFSKAANVDTASFKLKSNHLLESAGFAIDKGVTLELDMKADADRMVEWRKAGAGDLKITGTGNTNALLNVGGSGTVTLERTGGYAAYNVLASSGSTVVIDNLKQVYRDVTLGANGATLDLNGNNFEWNNSAPLSDEGFKSLHLLMEKDIVTNKKAGSTVTITITDPGTEAFVGAFRDTEQGAVNVVYNGNPEKTWVMNTVFTNLQNNEASSFTVQQGSVILQGINTIHGRQVLGKRPVNEFDWHYADAQMDVVINSGAEFTLGSHARLKGNVTVKDGGVFNMTEYTTHQYEYVEGGVKMDDTYLLRDYYGLHGNINLQGEDSMLYVQFAPQHYYQDTDSQSVYTGKITGSGSMVVDTAGGSLKLSGQNTFSGAKSLTGGTLVAESIEALGDTTKNKWKIDDCGVLAVEKTGVAEALGKIDGSSSGVLALTQNEDGVAPNLSGHQDLIIGAVGDIQFGQKDTDQTLSTNNNHEWLLGGGGGTLYVNYKLADDTGVLILGNQYTTGKVVLTNAGNTIDRIELVGGVTLDYESAQALGGAEVSLQYGNRMMGSADLIELVTEGSDGAVLLDEMSGKAIDLRTHGALSLAAGKTTKFTGTIELGENDTYHFGGGGGHLILDTVLSDVDDSTPRNMIVDAQYYRPAYGMDEEGNEGGDTIELTQAVQITGNVTVQGFDVSRAPGGDPSYILFNYSMATLQLSVDNALGSINSLILADGGFIDMNGTTQTLHGLITDESLLDMYGIVDNSEAQTSKLILDVTEGDEWDRWSPIMCNLGAHELVKTGDGTLVLLSTIESAVFTIQAGTVEIYSDEAVNSNGVTRVEGPGVLDVSELGEALVNKTIELNNGGTMLVGTDAISGSITASEGTGTLNATGDAATLDATIGAAQDATLALSNGSFTLRAAQNNMAGGTIDLQGGTLSLNNASGVSIGGTLKVSNNATINTTVNGATHQLNHLEVEDGVNLTISANNQSSVWNIHALEGSGNVTWQPGTNADARLVLDGEGSFSGMLTVEGPANPQSAPGLVLAHDLAAQHATISLQDNASMAVNTGNARIAGLNGNASSAVYAYESVTGATLTTTGADSYTYNGTIGTSAAMNIVMEGTGSQTYSGTVNAADVSALSGTLNLQGGNITIAGDVTVARGATLSTNSGLTLTEGQYLCSSGVSGAAGVVGGSVTFNGGGLSFDAAGLNGQTAALSFTGAVTHQPGLDVVFTNTNCLTAGSSMLLTSGNDWSGTNFTSVQLEYLTATFTAKGSELWVSFAQKSGNRIWDGTNQQHTWSSSAFGKGANLASTDTAVFNDAAENQSVQVSGNVSAKALLFDNSKEYSVNTDNGTLAAERVTLQGCGDVTLGGGVGITQTVNIGDGSTLVLENTDTLGENVKVDGAGTLAINSDELANLGGKVAHIGCVEVRGGALEVGQTLAADDIVVNSGAELLSTTGSILGGNATVHSAGYVEIDITSGSQDLNNAIAAGKDGVAGTFAKEGSGTLNVKKSLVADTVVVNGGRLDVSDTSMLPGFLTTTEQVVVNAGSSAYIGHNAYTIGLSQIGTDFVVDGGTLELAIAQNTTRTIAGNLTVKNGGKLYKVDGGLIFAGTTLLGDSVADQITLLGSWGKSGTIFDGVVHGAGNVVLRRERRDNSVEKFTFNNAGNTFSGEIEATQDTQLVAGHKSALATASNINLNGGSLVLAASEVDVKKLSGNGTLDFSAGDDRASATLNVQEGSFNGTVEANVSITKSGSGTFTLSGDTSKSNGTLTVKEGTLVLGAVSLDTPEIIVSGGALELTNTVNSISGALTINSGATLQLAECDNNAIAVGSLTLAGGSILDVSALGITESQVAPVTLMTGGSIAAPANVTINFGADASKPAYYALAVENNKLMLTFTPPSQDLIWDGKTNSNWSTTDTNWHTAAETETHVAFAKDANVTFESGTHTVSLTENIIAGDMKLAGGADVTISNAGNYTQEFINVTIEDGAKLRFGENGSTTVKGSLALNGTVTNDGNLTITEGTVASGTTGVLAGSGETTLNGTIANAGTVALDNANLTGGGDAAAITGNVVINGGTLSGTMQLGSKGSRVSVASEFELGADANYMILGDLVLDDLVPVDIAYVGIDDAYDGNGFIGYAEVRAYAEETTGRLELAQGACVTYKGVSGDFANGVLTCEADFSTFHMNMAEYGMVTYSQALETAGRYGFEDDFSKVRLAAGTGFEMDSDGAGLEKVTVSAGEAAAQLAITENASVDVVEMGADLAITGDGEKSLQLGSVQAAASETLIVNGPAVSVTGDMAGFHGSIDAQGGVLDLLNQNSLNVQDVTIAGGATVSAYTGTVKLDEYEATLTISGTLAAKGANGKLNANVVMLTDSTLDASATGGKGIALGSSLTIMENINLSDADFEAVAGLGYGESYTLFNGVDSLTLDQTYTGVITPEMKVDAAGWFRGVDAEHIYMVYDGSNVGLYCMVALPEPTTSTLSLLALAALCMRRRRKYAPPVSA